MVSVLRFVPKVDRNGGRCLLVGAGVVHRVVDELVVGECRDVQDVSSVERDLLGRVVGQRGAARASTGTLNAVRVPVARAGLHARPRDDRFSARSFTRMDRKRVVLVPPLGLPIRFDL